jgi:hypothetical protein
VTGRINNGRVGDLQAHYHELRRYRLEHSDSRIIEMNPSDQMTFVLLLLSDGCSAKRIMQIFGKDRHLARILMTSLVANGFIIKSGDDATVADKGRSRLKSSKILQSICQDLMDTPVSQAVDRSSEHQQNQTNGSTAQPSI